MVRELEATEKTVFLRLMSAIRKHRIRNVLRSRYADAEHRAALMGIAIPPSMENFAAVLGWPAKTCDVLARQMVPNGFTGGSQTALDEVNEVFDTNRVRLLEQQLIASAVRHGPAFAFVSRGDVGEPDPLVTVRSALEATAEIDRRTGRVTAALEVISNKEMLLYVPGLALTVERVNRQWMVTEEVPTIADAVLCTPYVHGGSLERPFGKSRITRPVMHLTDIAVRIMLRQEVGAEFFNAPQRYMLGAKMEMFKDEHGNPIPAWEALIGATVVVPDVPEDDPSYNAEHAKLNRVEVGQFAQMSMQPNSDHMKTIAMMFAGETAIPVNYLGLILDNPPSAESIDVMNADLKKVAKQQEVGMGLAREDLARNVLIALHGRSGAEAAKGIKSRWLVDDSERKSNAQEITQQVTAGILPPESVVTLEKLGYTEDEIKRIQADQRRARGQQIVPLLESARNQLELTQGPSPETQDKEQAAALRTKFEALGVAIRSGVDPENAAATLGLNGIQFTGAVPVSLRLPELEADGLED